MKKDELETGACEESPSVGAVDANTKNSKENELVEKVSYGYLTPRYINSLDT